MTKQRYTVVIIGAGLSGLAMAHALRSSGVDDFILLERADQIGGTWRDNSYPGCACDVPADLYALSFAPKPDWSHTYPTQPEIQAYILNIASQFDLERHIRFRQTVERVAFDARHGVWHVATKGGRELECRYLVSATGPLSRPVLPDLPDREVFEGEVIHTGLWPNGIDLKGKDVVVIGTGASGVQLVPAIADQVKSLHIVQRTPSWILSRFDDAIPASLQLAYARWPWRQRLARLKQLLRKEIHTFGLVFLPWIVSLYEDRGRRKLKDEISDTQLIDQLTPEHRLGCKRTILSENYYACLNRQNVHLVTDSRLRFTRDGLATGEGHHIPADVVVAATGFAGNRPLSSLSVRGLEGRDLHGEWAQGAEAFLGSAVNGYPNLFMLSGPNSGSGTTSVLLMVESQVKMIMRIMREARRRGAKVVEVKAPVQARYNTWLQRRMSSTIWATGCSSWYQTPSGKNVSIFPGLSLSFKLMCLRAPRQAFEYHALDSAERPC